MRVLFLCTGNSCRSQMAEGWARALLAADVQAHSAGIEPKPVHPLAIQVMKEAGVDISRQKPKHVRDLAGISFDLVVTVCDHARERCPVFSAGAKRLHKSFEDPAAAAGTEDEVLAAFRRVRDEIRDFVKSLPSSLCDGERR